MIRPRSIRNRAALRRENDQLRRLPAVEIDPAANLWHGLQAVNEWVKFADAKAAAVLTADGVLIALAAQSSSNDVEVIQLLPTLIGAVVSGLLALWALIPRLRMVRPSSPFYFDHVASECSDAGAYRRWVQPVLGDPEALMTTLADQIWAMSTVARLKYKWVRIATLLLGGATCWIIAALVIKALG